MKDAYGILSSDQVVTATAASEDYIDFGAAGKSYGKWASGAGGLKVYADIKDVTVDVGEDITVTIEDAAVVGTWATILTLASAKSVADAIADGEFVPPVGMPETHRRYVRAYYTCSTGTDTFSGTFNLWIAP